MQQNPTLNTKELPDAPAAGNIAWVAFTTIVRREIRRFLRIWVQTLLPPVITMSLYFLIFGSMIGNRIGEMDGVNYMTFILPGLIMMSVITNSYGNVVSSFFSSKFQRNIEELMVSPTSNWVIVLGYIFGGVARGLAVGFLVTVVALFFVDVEIQAIGLMLVVLLLTALIFASLGFINAIFAKTFDDISLIPTFVLTPLTYLGGVFYSLSLLPSLWYKLSMLNPIVYIVNTFRYSIIGVSDIDIFPALMVMILLAAGLLVVANVLIHHPRFGIRS